MGAEAGDRALETARKISKQINCDFAISQDAQNYEVSWIAALIQSAMNAAMKQKELGVIEHFKNAVSDGCVCGVCEAVREAMNAQERELTIRGRELVDETYALRNCLRRMIQDLPMKRDWLDPDTEREARRLLAERGEGR